MTSDVTELLTPRRALRVKSVAARYDVSVTTVRRWMDAGLPFVKRQGTVLIFVDDLERFLREGYDAGRERAQRGKHVLPGKGPAPGGVRVDERQAPAARVPAQAPAKRPGLPRSQGASGRAPAAPRPRRPSRRSQLDPWNVPPKVA